MFDMIFSKFGTKMRRYNKISLLFLRKKFSLVFAGTLAYIYSSSYNIHVFFLYFHPILQLFRLFTFYTKKYPLSFFFFRFLRKCLCAQQFAYSA